jgi:hypothetical protein
MEAESRPGSPARINLGWNYAQPVTTFDAIPSGNELNRVISYLGDRNCGAPYTSIEERKSESIAEASEEKGTHGAELELLKRAYAIRDNTSEVFALHSVYI